MRIEFNKNGGFDAISLPIDLEEVISQRLEEIDLVVFQILEAATAAYSALEKSTWTRKREQAELFELTGDARDCPSLLLEATATARTLAGGEVTGAQIEQALQALVTGIVIKASEIEQLQAQVIGWRTAMKQAIAELPTIEAVQEFPIVPPF